MLLPAFAAQHHMLDMLMPNAVAHNTFDAAIPANIAFALDTSAAMRSADPSVEIPGVLAGLTHSAPHGTSFSVVAGGSVAALSDAQGAARAFERVASYGGSADVSQLLSVAAATVAGGDNQNVIILV